jgi:hypothetical protein
VSSSMLVSAALGLQVIKEPEFAIRYAELLILQRYGADALAYQQPLSAADEGAAWRVTGSPPPLPSLDVPYEKAGQTILINKADGRVLEWHGLMAAVTIPERRT